MAMVQLLVVLGMGPTFGPGLAAGHADGPASLCPAGPDGAPGRCAGGPTAGGVETRGLALLQGRGPTIQKVRLNEFPTEEDLAAQRAEEDALPEEEGEPVGVESREWCKFALEPPTENYYFWDPACKGGGVGCNADNQHMECRWCGFGPYPPCPLCTSNDIDVWKTGSRLPCCSGLQECLGKFTKSYWHYRCLPSCSGGPAPAPPPPAVAPPAGQGLWQTSGATVGDGWCKAQVPAAGWNLKGSCGGATQVKVLTYNLFWWNLYGRRKGNGNSAGKLISAHGPFDIIGFQECDDVHRILREAGLGGSHEAVVAGHATAMAFQRDQWERLGSGQRDVAEDRRSQYYGKRGVGWLRLKHRQSGRVVFAMNHHGPLEVNTGGQCGGTATAYSMLREIGEHAEAGDVTVLMGDLNADRDSATQRTLGAHMYRNGYHWVDAFFSSCPSGLMKDLGKGGSDHNALSLTLQI